MFRSVFTKFVSLFMLILLASFLVLTTILTSLVNTYNIDAKMNSMADAAYSVSVYLRDQYIESEQTGFDNYLISQKDSIMPVIDLLSVNVDDMALWVVDETGVSILTGGSGQKKSPDGVRSGVHHRGAVRRICGNRRQRHSSASCRR